MHQHHQRHHVDHHPTPGLYGDLIASADSLAWSMAALRARKPSMPGCTHATCASCLAYALNWRRRQILPRRTAPSSRPACVQDALFGLRIHHPSFLNPRS